MALRLPLPLPSGGLKCAQIQGANISQHSEVRAKNICADSMKCTISWISAKIRGKGVVVAAQNSSSTDMQRELLADEDSPKSEDATGFQSSSDIRRSNPADGETQNDAWARLYASRLQPPLLAALKECAARDAAPFHFPGHRRGLGAPFRMVDTVGMSTFAHDLPDLPELDNLFSPEGVIHQAQNDAAELFGADKTFFLINGSTCGIQASVMATCWPGDYLILPRNCHLSATSAMVLSGALPKYVMPLYDSRWGIAHGVTPQSIYTAIQEVRGNGGRVGAVLVVSPTYFGVCSPIAKIAEVCNNNGVALIVDEAHGAHFMFHEALPMSAMEQGADAAVQSTHKVLGSLTQSAMLHVRGHQVHPDYVTKSLRMLQSTSPSYLLLASLDAAGAQMSEEGVIRLTKALDHAAKARERLKAEPSLVVLDEDTIMHGDEVLDSPELDPLRITIGLWGLSIDGYDADDFLRLEFGVIAEMPAMRTITFVVTLGTCERDIDRLVESLTAMAARFSQSDGSSGSDLLHQQDELFNASKLPFRSVVEWSPRDAFFFDTVDIDAALSIGKICGELLCPYPPGIPIITPGEVISEEALSYLKNIVKCGHFVTGAWDPTLGTIRILDERYD